MLYDVPDEMAYLSPMAYLCLIFIPQNISDSLPIFQKKIMEAEYSA
jgi:hypothetical protein